ncbi:MAG: nucleoside hydrolase [Candidatus Nanohaloarchaea archaeon]|nr:nucleoside hydrolase [Candidatus Nanohaloarchaea archaeon]
MILDTDIGGDPDDIFALLLALNSPENKLDLVITSNEHRGHRASFAEEIAGELGFSLEVVPGMELGREEYCLVCDVADEKVGSDMLERIAGVVEEQERTKYVTIGPQTNLARFIGKYPELASDLHVSCMGGYIDRERSDYNIRADLESAKAVFNSEADTEYVTADVTNAEPLKIGRENDLYRHLISSSETLESLLEYNAEAFKKSMGHKKFYTYMHDPLTVSAALGKEFVSFDEENIQLDSKGSMQISESGTPTRIAKSARYGEFMEFLYNRIGGIL